MNTPQSVMKKFVAKLANHGYSYSSEVSIKMLDDAVKASSKYDSIQEVIDAMKTDQVKAEKEAIETIVKAVCGETYFKNNCVDSAGKTKSLSEIENKLATATKADGSAITYSDVSKWVAGYYSSLANVIREHTANTFLQVYCGILLNHEFGFGAGDNSETIYRFVNKSTGNVDTGAITGSDANITLKVGSVVEGRTLTAADLQTLAKQDGITLSSDGQSIVIGTGTEKTDRSVVPEDFVNTYPLPPLKL